MAGRDAWHPLVRDHHIPLRNQLAADLEAGIRDGDVRPGAPLPSARALARRLGLDRGTVCAALGRLRDRNLIELTSGRRPRTTPPHDLDWPAPPSTGSTPTTRPARAAIDTARATARRAVFAVLRRACAEGVSRWEVLDEIRHIVDVAPGAPPAPRRPPATRPASRVVTLYEPRPGLRSLLCAELSEACRANIRAADPGRGIPVGTPIIVRRELLPRIRWSAVAECIPVRLAGGTRERGLVRAHLSRGLVVLLCQSETVRVFASELAARDFNRGISFTALDPDQDGPATHRAVAAAALIFHDRRTDVPPTKRPSTVAVPITLVPPQEAQRIRRYLGAGGNRRSRPGSPQAPARSSRDPPRRPACVGPGRAVAVDCSCNLLRTACV